MSRKKTITKNEVQDTINSLSFIELKKLLNTYSEVNKVDTTKSITVLSVSDLQDRLEALHINNTCPYCNSPNRKLNDTRNKVKRYKCSDCNKTYSVFTDTILEKTKYHWDIWVAVLEMLLNNYSLPKMQNVLEKDYGCIGINYKTVFLWRHKLLFALSKMPMPKLSGVIQVDETFLRETQKGSRHLVSTINTKDIRKARYGYRPSQMGVLGPEFTNITTAVDSKGHCVCKVSGLGRLTKEVFKELFHDYFDNPSYICSDAYSVYEDYCTLTNIAHYVRPSNYAKIIMDAGYETPDHSNPSKAEITKQNNRKLLKKLYNEQEIDYISNRGFLLYEDFDKLKKDNRLALSRVNELHKDLKLLLEKQMTNVSTKYINDYVGFFTYIRNWKVDNGHYPASKKDAEKIFIEILKTKVNYTINDLNNAEIDLPKPSSKYISILNEETAKARKATSNKYFKFNPEDGLGEKTFNKRDYLLDQSKSKLYQICKDHSLKKYRQLALYSLVSLILKLPDIDEIIYNLVINDRNYKIDEEDKKYIDSRKFGSI